MNTPLLVCKRLEHRGLIGGLYVHEAMLLLMGTVLVFISSLLIRKAWNLPLLWTLTAPALFVIIALVAKTLRQQNQQPHYLMAYITFYWLAPPNLTPYAPLPKCRARKQHPHP
ncbi:MAG: hypothetical protein AAFQ78_01510 [Bacteroidota bacterium]